MRNIQRPPWFALLRSKGKAVRIRYRSATVIGYCRNAIKPLSEKMRRMGRRIPAGQTPKVRRPARVVGAVLH